MCRKLTLLVCLVLSVSLAYALPSPSPASSVVLSSGEVSSISSALEQAREALERSSKEIKTQSRQLKALWILCGVLVAVDVAATGLAVYEGGRSAGWWK
jgi:hypothetical protein